MSGSASFLRLSSGALSPRAARLVVFPLALALAGCSKEPPRFFLELGTGGEADALGRTPVPTRVEVDGLDSAGTARSLLRAGFDPAARTLDLGRSVDNGSVLAVRYRARDDQGNALVFGQSALIALATDDEATLRVFVQRTGEFARTPLALADAALAGADGAPILTDTLGARYVVVVADKHAELVDLATFGSTPFSLPRPARSVVATANGLLVIDDAGAALFDTRGTATPITVPQGGSLADVAGGGVVRGASGAYVVGGTRASAPSATVLRVTDDGALSFGHLAEARTAAAATWIAGRGLVIVGGSATAGAIEVLADGATASSVLSFPALADGGLGAVPLDDHRIVVAGGSAAPRVFDLACAASCASGPFFTGGANGSTLPSLASPDLARLTDGSALVLGKGDDGKMHAFRMQEASPPSELTLRVARSRARILPGNAGALLVVGGASEVESFVIDP